LSERYNATRWLVDRHVENGDGSRLALLCGDVQWTYADLQRFTFRAANALASLGVRPEERVALVANDEPGLVAWFLGAMRLGAVPVPVSTMLTSKEVAFIVDDARAGVVVLSEAYAGHLPVLADACPDLRAAVVLAVLAPTDGAHQEEEEEEEALQAGFDVYAERDFDDFAEPIGARTDRESPGFWLYTSGTTGSPKGAMHRHGSLQATADTYGRHVLAMSPDDRCFSIAKLFFAYGLGNSLTFPFSVGAASILSPDRPTPAGVAALLEQTRPTLAFLSPGFCAALLDAHVPPGAFSSVRAAITAGETLPAPIYERFTTAFSTPILDGIGSTEALHIFMSNHLGAERAGTTGAAVDGYEVRLLDDNDQVITDPDVPGYLHVRGESIATGYWRRSDVSRANFRGEWLRTGDVYTRSDDGYYTFLGRNNDMIKAGGIWVAPAEVEEVILRMPGVLECAVVGVRQQGLETVVAFVVPRSGQTVDQETLEAHCRQHMAAFKRPRHLVVVDSLPRTATGKVQRFALRDLLGSASG
jgi:benzoate-CoA ligase family protein